MVSAPRSNEELVEPVDRGITRNRNAVRALDAVDVARPSRFVVEEHDHTGDGGVDAFEPPVAEERDRAPFRRTLKRFLLEPRVDLRVQLDCKRLRLTARVQPLVIETRGKLPESVDEAGEGCVLDRRNTQSAKEPRSRRQCMRHDVEYLRVGSSPRAVRQAP